MNFESIIIAAATFFIIGIFHPIVIKAEYYLGTKCWWMFALAGIIFIVLSPSLNINYLNGTSSPADSSINISP